MTCHHPLTGYHKVGGGWTHNRSQSYIDRGSMVVPCGQCQGCRVDRMSHWATRISHESSLYDHNCFLTLTYDETSYQKLDGGSLEKDHFPTFLRALRDQRRKQQPCPYNEKWDGEYLQPQKRKQWLKEHAIRFYHCAEYGTKTDRAHHHAIIFNYNFKDRTYFRKAKDGSPVFTSKILNSLWQHGEQNEIGTVTPASAGYVAGYIMEKITGKQAIDAYCFVDPNDGTYVDRLPPFSSMSNRPGIGAPWYERWKTDIYPHDYTVLEGKLRRPPPYYDYLLSLEDEKTHSLIKEKRTIAGRLDEWNKTPERLNVRKKVQAARLSQNQRPL